MKLLGEQGLKYEVEKVGVEVENLGVGFDVWYCETCLYEKGKMEGGVERVGGKGYVFEEDGGRWLG